MDDTLACFSSRNEALSFFRCLNDLHPSLTFTMDEEKYNKLSFLNVLVERRSFAFVTYIENLRSPACIWVGILLLLRPGRLTWSSHSHSRLLRFVRIRLKANWNRLKFIWGNGYLEEFIVDTITKLIGLGITSDHLALLNVQFVWLPWIRSPSQLIVDKVSSSVTRCYVAMVRTIFTAWAAFRSVPKDVLPIFQQSNLIYKFQCCCNTTYIGLTSQRLEVK